MLGDHLPEDLDGAAVGGGALGETVGELDGSGRLGARAALRQQRGRPDQVHELGRAVHQRVGGPARGRSG